MTTARVGGPHGVDSLWVGAKHGLPNAWSNAVLPVSTTTGAGSASIFAEAMAAPIPGRSSKPCASKMRGAGG
jgi:hypothetical protein